MNTKSKLSLLALLILAAPMALAATNVITFISLTPNPVTDPSPATITGTILERVPPNTPGGPVSGANVAIQELELLGVGVACESPSPPAVWGNIYNATTDINGRVSTTFDTTGLGGRTICFRTKPDDSSVVSGNPSPGADLVILPPVSACTPGATIAATLAAGDGTPGTGNTGPWTFRITVTACGPLTNVTAQGGANGWAPVSGAFPDYGTVADRKVNKNNTIKLWTIGTMTSGQVANLDVVVEGPIPHSAPDCQVRYLSGPWSAMFSTDGGITSTKSVYSGRVSVSVDTNGDGNDSCP